MTTAAAPAARRMLVPPLISAGKLVRKDATNCRRDVGVPTTSMNAMFDEDDVNAKLGKAAREVYGQGTVLYW